MKGALRKFADGGSTLPDPGDNGGTPAILNGVANGDYSLPMADPNDPGALNRAAGQQYSRLMSDEDAANQQKSARIQQALNALQVAKGGQNVNLPLLAAAAAIGAPTHSGNFSEALSNAMGAAVPQIQQQRQQDMAYANQLNQLGLLGADADTQAARQKMGDFNTWYAQQTAQQNRYQDQANKDRDFTNSSNRDNTLNAYTDTLRQNAATEEAQTWDHKVPVLDDDKNPVMQDGLPLYRFYNGTKLVGTAPFDPKEDEDDNKIKPAKMVDQLQRQQALLSAQTKQLNMAMENLEKQYAANGKPLDPATRALEQAKIESRLKIPQYQAQYDKMYAEVYGSAPDSSAPSQPVLSPAAQAANPWASGPSPNRIPKESFIPGAVVPGSPGSGD